MVLVSILPAVLAVIVLALGAREVASAEKTCSAVRLPEGMDGRFKVLPAGRGLFTLGNSSDAFIILRGQERGLSVLQVMCMLMTFTAIYTLLAGPLGALSDRIGRRKLIIGGWLAYGLVYLGFAFSDHRLADLGAVRAVWDLLRRHRRHCQGPGSRPGAGCTARHGLWTVQRRHRPDRSAGLAHRWAALAGAGRLDGFWGLGTVLLWGGPGLAGGRFVLAAGALMTGKTPLDLQILIETIHHEYGISLVSLQFLLRGWGGDCYSAAARDGCATSSNCIMTPPIWAPQRLPALFTCP